MVCRVAALLCAVLVAVSAYSGVDVSQATLESHWKCLKENGYHFAVIRCYESVGRVDSNCPHTIYNAWDGGMSHVDIYMFPDPRANNPESQMSSMVEFLKKYSITSGGKKPGSFGMVWLDIEGSQYWSSDKETNRKFFDGLVSEGKKHGLKLGVYTSESQWSPIMGDWSGGSSLPLWYAHYDGRPSFSDFRSFGGWKKPAIKQYNGDKTICGAGVDVNWYPDSEKLPMATMANLSVHL
ncbi:uncharacterized protein MONBRDRAFT_34277 [Monosiga brevicollis MX1]|uniref:Lysozyme n=1 Tax=Monosiga brevicollis TaxID=81824 RepID=A9VAN2_MONBE|nr:uncharacterized protein MONBRDRAFT_34277 [Monosiga brevicollis MX1]EDQ85403.1 predicted protein [Monosiga brevicollis MX1]|eukprot:XP_001749814.1 hypothetical protein [Monosiga brevicollis MX1]